MVTRQRVSRQAHGRARAKPPARAVLVTGGSGGIGRAICVAFAQEGWHVGVHYRREKSAAETTLRLVERAGGLGGVYQADIRESHAVQLMFETFCHESRGLSAVICNAGVGVSDLLVRLKPSDWDGVIDTNLTGTFHCLRSAAHWLQVGGGGSIVVVGSYSGFHGSAGQAAYAASKAGLIGLVKTAALEWGPDNIRVNMVLPGWHNSALTQGRMPDIEEMEDHALRRTPTVGEVAQTIVHLAAARDVSGQIWNCDSRIL